MADTLVRRCCVQHRGAAIQQASSRDMEVLFKPVCIQQSGTDECFFAPAFFSKSWGFCMNKPTLLSRTISRRFAAAAAVSLFALTSGSAMAAIVCGPGANVSVPDSFDGVYYNFLTGVAAASGAANPGWDWNPYNSGTGLSFFWPGATTGGGVGTGAVYDVLAAGTPVSAASTFVNLTATAATAAFKAGVSGGFLGFRFQNETTAAVNYGWAALNTTAGTGFPMTIVQYCYENTGAAIPAGTTPVSLQSYSVD